MQYVTAIKRELVALGAGKRGRMFTTIALAWGLLVGTRMIFPVLLPYLRVDFGLTLTTAGLLITILWLAYALGQMPSGILVDRYGERTLLTVSIALVVVGIGLVLVAPSALPLFAATAFVGGGMSMYTIARITALSDLYPERLGSALGVTMATGDIGQTILPPLAGALAVIVAWQVGLGFVVPFLVVVGIYIWLTLPGDTDSTAAPEGLSLEAFRDVLGEIRQPATVIMGGVLCLFILVWQTFSAFYPTYLIEVKGFSPTAAGLIFGLYFAVGIVAKPISGRAYDVIGARRTLPLILIGPIVGLVVLPMIDGLWPLVAVTLLIATAKGSGAITQPYLAEVLPKEIQGTGLGVIRSTAATIGAAGPVLFGIAADFGYFDASYIGLAVVIAVALVVTLRLPDHDR